MTLRASRKQQVANAILDAAKGLFIARGVEATAIEEIAREAGVSRATLFNYYRGKRAIVDALAAELEPRLVQLVAHYRSKPLSLAGRIEALFAYAGKVLAQTSALSRELAVQGSGGAGFPLLADAFAQLVRDGQSRGEARSDLSAETLGETVYLAFMAGLLDWNRREDTSLPTLMAKRAQTCARLLAPGGDQPA